jgi:hypothetical protein
LHGSEATRCGEVALRRRASCAISDSNTGSAVAVAADECAEREIPTTMLAVKTPAPKTSSTAGN